MRRSPKAENNAGFEQRAVLATIISAVLTLFALFMFANKAVAPAFRHPSPDLSSLGNDFAAYYMGAWEAAQGHSPYHNVEITDQVRYRGEGVGEVLGTHAAVIPGFIYPPPVAYMLRPFLLWPFREALTAWLLLNCALVLLCLGLNLILFSARGRWPVTASLAAVVFLASMPTRENVLLGQINYAVFFLGLLAYFAYERRYPFLAGGILAVATWIKVVPAFLLIYFLFHKRSWPVLWGFFAVAGAFGLWTIVLIGPDETVRYFAQVLPAAGQWQLSLNNKSFLAIFDRLFAPNPLMPPVIFLPWLGKLCKAVFVAGLLYFGYRLHQHERRRPPSFSQYSDRLLYAAAMLLMLLAQPLLQVHHLIFAFPALLVAITAAVTAPRPTGVWLVALSAFLLNSRGWDAFAHGPEWFRIFFIAPQVWGLVLLGVIVFRISRNHRARAQSA